MNPAHHYRVKATGEFLGQFKEARARDGYGTDYLFIRTLHYKGTSLLDNLESVEDAAFARRKHALAARIAIRGTA